MVRNRKGRTILGHLDSHMKNKKDIQRYRNQLLRVVYWKHTLKPAQYAGVDNRKQLDLHNSSWYQDGPVQALFH